MSNGPEHIEVDGIHETHVTHFQLATMDNEVVLTCGEMKPEVTEDGQSEIREIRYDTKLRMTPETAFQLKELLTQSFDGPENT